MPALTGHTTVHDPLESHGSRCSAVAGTALPRPRAPPVSSWPMAKAEQRRPFAPAPLQGLRRYYGLLRPCAPLRYSRPRGWSRLRLVPSRRQRDEAQVLTFHTKAWSSFAPPTCRMPLGQASGFSRADPGGRVTPRFRHRLIRFRHFIGGSLALASLNLACRDQVPTFPQRSPPSLLTTATCGGLRPAPDCRPRRALLHLSYSSAPSYSDSAFVTHAPKQIFWCKA